MDSVQADWEAYRRESLPSEISEVHLQIAKKAFYAGVESALVENWSPPIMPPLPDDPGWLTKLQGNIPVASPFYDAPDVVMGEEAMSQMDPEWLNKMRGDLPPSLSPFERVAEIGRQITADAEGALARGEDVVEDE